VNAPATVLLNNGHEVLAKMYAGELYAATYSNRTQAQNKAAELGPPWAVFHWGRPFYVARNEPGVRYAAQLKTA
jgi:hypothetical protein